MSKPGSLKLREPGLLKRYNLGAAPETEDPVDD